MIYQPAKSPEAPELRYRPSYIEVADPEVSQRYQNTERLLLESREGSEYIRKKIAQIENEKKLRKLACLPRNWDSYGSDRPSATAIEAGVRISEDRRAASEPYDRRQDECTHAHEPTPRARPSGSH